MVEFKAGGCLDPDMEMELGSVESVMEEAGSRLRAGVKPSKHRIDVIRASGIIKGVNGENPC